MKKSWLMLVIVFSLCGLTACGNQNRKHNPSYHTRISESNYRHKKPKTKLTKKDFMQIKYLYQQENSLLQQEISIKNHTMHQFNQYPHQSARKIHKAFKTSIRTNAKVKEKIIHPQYYNQGSKINNIQSTCQTIDRQISSLESKSVKNSQNNANQISQIRPVYEKNIKLEQQNQETNHQFQKLCQHLNKRYKN